MKLRSSSKRKRTEVTEPLTGELLIGIPDELVIMEILAKHVDVKTLGACKVVSKWWHKTLHSQEFIDTHRHHHRQSMQVLFVDFEWESIDIQRLRFSMGNHHEISVIKMAELAGIKDSASVHDVSPVCRDLVCVNYSGLSESTLVYNPWTGQGVNLPSDPYSSHYEPVVFGYLTSRRKYVVVKVCESLRTRVYKLSFDLVNYHPSSEWKWEIIEDVCPQRGVGEGVFVNNFVYWHISDFTNSSKNELIVSLDVEKENFGVIKCPQTPYWESLPHLCSVSITLLDFNGTLGLTDLNTMYEARVFKLWTLKHELGQWEMMYIVDLDNLGIQLVKEVLEFSPKSSVEGELILQSLRSQSWHIYNPKTNRIRNITRPPSDIGARFKSCKLASFFVETWPPTKLY